MKSKANQNIQIFGASIMHRQLTALVQEINGVRRSRDIEYIHRMRVATRRLRSALPLFGILIAEKKWSYWFRRIRGLTRALGEARDADVQIEHLDELQQTLTIPVRAGVRRLMLRIKQKRRALQVNVLDALSDFEQSKIVEDMAQRFAPLDIYRDTIDKKDVELLRLAADAINEKLKEFLAFSEIVDKPERIEELHAMRIAAKHLRYTIEFFAPLYENELKPHLKALREAQELLGSIHDCDVWIAYLPQFMQEERQRTVEYFGYARPYKRLEPGLLYYQQLRSEERENLFLQFNKNWKEWEEKRTWADLLDTIQFALAPQTTPETQPAVQDVEKNV
jgi:CHAD domain-containing protein